jgi:uroporphyrinogen decarboxylase
MTVDRPIWLMRQAGRYLPEYRDLRARKASFLDLCFDPAAATEATLQPIRRFGFDAAIMFSDILVVPYALGQAVSFETGEGPRLQPITTGTALAALADTLDLERLAPVFEILERVRSALPSSTSLLGFCGAPWTVASYMVAGKGTPDQAPGRLLAYRDPALFGALIDRLVEASVLYLDRQLAAGADAVQIFDSWAGVLPTSEFDRLCLEPIGRIVRGVKQLRPNARVIVFARCAGANLLRLARTCGADVIGLDTNVDQGWAASEIQRFVPLQGNLDPLVLLAGGSPLDLAIDHILQAFAAGPHIFNLGHGILPDTPIENVERLLKRVRYRE